MSTLGFSYWSGALHAERGIKVAAFALIEIPQESWEQEDLNPKGMIREACIEFCIGSQLLASFKKNEKAGPSRVKNAKDYLCLLPRTDNGEV
jgi:hypothetical protein